MEANSKFAMTDGAFVGSFGGLWMFHEGLERRLGLPNPQVFKAMESEHCNGSDASQEFKALNYGTVTTPAQEWEFVIRSVDDKQYPGPERCRMTIPSLMDDPKAVQSGLTIEELVALRL